MKKQIKSHEIEDLIKALLLKDPFQISAKKVGLYPSLSSAKVIVDSTPLTKRLCPFCNNHSVDIILDKNFQVYTISCELGGIEILDFEEVKSFEISSLEFFKWLGKELNLEIYSQPQDLECIKIIGETIGFGVSFKVAFVFTDNYSKVIDSIKELSSEKNIIYFLLGKTPIIGRVSNVFSLYDVLFIEDNELRVNKDIFKSLEGYEPKQIEGFKLGWNIYIQKEDNKHFLKFNYDKSIDVYHAKVSISPLQYRLLRHFFDNPDESYTTGDLAKEGLTSSNKASNEVSILNKKCIENNLPEILAKLTKGSDKFSINPALYTT